MATTGQVHWHEGLFLQPHHLQCMQRQVLEQFSVERRLAWPYPYGLIEAAVSPDALANMQVRFERLWAIMPSGLEVNLLGNADLPPLDIRKAVEASSKPFLVSLGVPQWDPQRANTVSGEEAWKSRQIYLTVEREVPDENTGANPQPVPLRRINARLLLEDHDRTYLETLPLLWVTRSSSDEAGMPALDPAFVPPCLVLSASASLHRSVRDLADFIEAQRAGLAQRMGGGGFQMSQVHGEQIGQVLRLQALNRCCARLPQLVEAPNVSPFDVYLELREMLGFLAALRPSPDLFDVPAYDHDSPAVAFSELDQRIRRLVPAGGDAKPLQVPFRYDERRKVLLAELGEEHLTKPNEYFLSVQTRMEPRALVQLVENSNEFKLMPLSMARSLVFGMGLKEERVPPQGFPMQVDLHYFGLLLSRSAKMWDRIKAEKALTAWWRGVESTDFKLTLWMTVPSQDQDP